MVWLTQYYLPTDRRERYQAIARRHVEFITKLQKTRGPLGAIVILKAVRLHMTRAIAGQPLRYSAHPAVGINKMG
nr:MAG: hypothetical protein H3RhizoLitter151437_000001 [Mitovirus sp.]